MTPHGIFLRELKALTRDRWLLALLSWLPLSLFGLMYLLFSQQIPRELPMAVVDLDQSQVTRALIRQYEASPTLKVDDRYLEVHAAQTAMQNGDIYALAIIPADLGRDVTIGRPVQVTVFVNDQFLLIGKIINSALIQAHTTFNARLETGRNLYGDAPVIELAIAQASPTAQQVTPLFNLGVNYAQFLVSAILPAVWQIVMVAATILALIAAGRDESHHDWPAPAPARNLLARLAPLSIIFWLQGALFLSTMYVWLGWPMHGSWPLLLVAQFLTAWASIASGTLIFFVSGTRPETALSLAASYAAPALAFMGVTFPVTDMTLPARIWRSLIPVSHYIELQFAQVNYGSASIDTIPQLLALVLFTVPMILALRIAAWRMPRQPIREAAS